MPAGPRQFAGHRKLSSLYFFYFACLGAVLPYWSLYLQHLDFTAVQIGELSAALLATKIIAPAIWGWIADHTGQRMRLIRIAAFLGMGIFSAVLLVRGYWALFLVLAGFGFFWNAALPQFEATTMDHLGEEKHMYSRIRLWGSIGFIVTVSALAPLLQSRGIGLLPWAVLVILFCTWINTLFVKDKSASTAHAGKFSLLKTCTDPAVVALLLAAFLIQMSHGPYYTFFSIYLEEHGYPRAAVGQFWSLGVIAEVVFHGIQAVAEVRCEVFADGSHAPDGRAVVADCHVCRRPAGTAVRTVAACSFVRPVPCIGHSSDRPVFPGQHPGPGHGTLFQHQLRPGSLAW